MVREFRTLFWKLPDTGSVYWTGDQRIEPTRKAGRSTICQLRIGKESGALVGIVLCAVDTSRSFQSASSTRPPANPSHVQEWEHLPSHAYRLITASGGPKNSMPYRVSTWTFAGEYRVHFPLLWPCEAVHVAQARSHFQRHHVRPSAQTKTEQLLSHPHPAPKMSCLPKGCLISQTKTYELLKQLRTSHGRSRPAYLSGKKYLSAT